MSSIPDNQIDNAALPRLATSFYREALKGNLNLGGGAPARYAGWIDYIKVVPYLG